MLKTDAARFEKLNDLLARLRRGEIVQNRQLRTWLGEQGYREYEESWSNTIDQRNLLSSKSGAIIEYEHLLKKAIMLYNRGEVASQHGRQSARQLHAKSHRKPTWYMKLKIRGLRKHIDRSTKLTKYEDAYAFARKEYDRLTTAADLGHAIDDYTFEKHWEDWYQRNVNNRTWRADRQRWHKNQAARYYKAYFRYADGKSMRLNKSFQQFLSRVPVDDAEHGLLYNKENEKRSLYSLRHT